MSQKLFLHRITYNATILWAFPVMYWVRKRKEKERIRRRLNWPLDLTDCFPYHHLSLVSSIKEGSSDGQHGVAGLRPKCWEDFVNHRVLDASRPSMYTIFQICFCHKSLANYTIESKQRKCYSYHKGEALHLGHLLATDDLHCMSWWGEVSIEYWGTVHLSPPKHAPPKQHTDKALYPALILIQWWSTAPAVMHKGSIFIWDRVGSVFIFFPLNV